jgi:polar amino acid transport system substrate-binding protein
MPTRTIVLTSLALLICVALTGTVVTKAASPAGCSRFVLTGHPSYPPVSYANGATLDGAGIQVVRALAAQANEPIQVVNEGSWDAAQQAVQAGKADAIVGIYLTQKRQNLYDYLQPAIATDPSAVIVKTGSPFVYHDWQSLIGMRGVVSEGEEYGHQFDVFMNAKLTIKRVHGFDAVYKAVIDGDADYGLVGYYAALEGAPKGQIKVATSNFVTENLYLAFRKDSPCSHALSPTFSIELTAMIANGAVKKLFAAALASLESSRK